MGDVIETNPDQPEVAVELAPNSAEIPDLAVSEPKPKKRKTGIQSSEAKIITAKAKLSKLEGKLTAAKAATGYGTTVEARRKTVQQLSDQVKAQQLAVVALQKHMDDQIALADAKAQVAREKEKKAALEAEIKVASGDACLVAIVESKMSQDKHFDGKVEKNEKVWKDRVYPKFMRLIENGDLPSTDKMSCDAMQSKYSSELAHFRKYAKDVQRYKQSGASADDVDRIPKRCAPLPNTCAPAPPTLPTLHSHHPVPARPVLGPPRRALNGTRPEGDPWRDQVLEGIRPEGNPEP